MKTCYDIILKYVMNKDVLDIGSCGKQGEKTKAKTLFNLIKKNARSVIGVDIESNADEIIKGNAETIKLNKKVDIVVAGDVIEHLYNPGLFLENMRFHLKKNGLMVIVTPNVKSLAYIFFRGNRFHTCWYCRHTLKYLIERHGFRVSDIMICLRRRKSWPYDIFRYLFANHLLFVCRKLDKK